MIEDENPSNFRYTNTMKKSEMENYAIDISEMQSPSTDIDKKEALKTINAEASHHYGK